MLSNDPRVHVVAAVIQNQKGEVLLSLRPKNSHQGGLWEFPGGKVEPEENLQQALARELDEELGIQVQRSRPLIHVSHDYPDRSVLLDVWRILEFKGVPEGREGQRLEWVKPHELYNKSMPVADLPIVKAILLPDCYLITPDPEQDHELFLDELKKSLKNGIRLVQFRAKSLSESSYLELARKVVSLCHAYEARVLLNSSYELVKKVGADGVNLNSKQLSLLKYPFDPEDGMNLLVGASCHSSTELENAVALGVDFAMLSPVLATASHPEAKPLGWDSFREITETKNLPIYALGGMEKKYLDTAFEYGAQGIAAIRSLWGTENNISINNKLNS